MQEGGGQSLPPNTTESGGEEPFEGFEGLRPYISLLTQWRWNLEAENCELGAVSWELRPVSEEQNVAEETNGKVKEGYDRKEN